MWAFLLFLAVATPAFAEPKNGLIIETDMLDDDRRALLDLFLHKETAERIKLIIVSTGNVHLRTAELQQMVWGLGLDIKVVAGKATDTATNPLTSFTSGVDNEGKWLLTQSQIARLTKPAVAKADGRAGKYLEKIVQDASKSGEKLDVLLLTAPKVLGQFTTDQRGSSKQVFHNLFGMGLWKKTASGLTAPFNFRAGDAESIQILDAFHDGVFNQFYHVRTDVVQNHSGLPGGFVPEDGALRNSLERAMNGNEFLRRVLNAAREYGLAWVNWSMRALGLGNTDGTRWVPDSWKSPETAHAFYYADMAPAQLAKMSDEELAELTHTKINHRAKFTPREGTAGDITFETGGAREITDVEEIDGAKALTEHVKLLLKARNIRSDARFNQNTDFVHVDPSEVDLKASPHLKQRALVLSFKNAPDDWMGLAHILNTEEGRVALSRGGIITEGFQTKEVMESVRSVLSELGIFNVAVAAGHEYLPDEIKDIRNLDFEKKFYEWGEGTKAFADLEPSTQAHTTPEEIMKKAFDWAGANQGKVDAILYGEGENVLDGIAKLSDKEIAEKMGSIFSMGGGRPNDVANLSKGYVKTRNWLRITDKIFDSFHRLGKLGKKVFVFSSDQFGGSMVARTDKNLGNGEVMFGELDRLSMDSKVLTAIRDHWERWSRVFSQQKNATFDPDAQVTTLSTSPIGLHIADAWVLGEVEGSGSKEIGSTNQNLREYLAKGPQTEAADADVVWLTRSNNRDIARLAARFGINLDFLVLSNLGHQLDEAVRLKGPNSKEARGIQTLLEGYARSVTLPVPADKCGDRYKQLHGLAV